MTHTFRCLLLTLLVILAPGYALARGGGGCFLPQTPVLTPDGPRAIGEIRPGDHVLAFSPDEKIVAAKVRQVFTLHADEYWIIQTERASVEATGEHPFYIGDGAFRTAESLRLGDAIYCRDGDGIAVQHVVSIKRVFRGTAVVNLHTDEPNTFFAAGFAVHNKGGGGRIGGGSFRSSPSGRGWRLSPRGSASTQPWSRQDGATFIALLVCVLLIFAYSAWKHVSLGVHRGTNNNHSTSPGIFNPSDSQLDRLFSPAEVQSKANTTQSQLLGLARFDATFEPDTLRGIATEAFFTLQDCWTRRDYAAMKKFVTREVERQHEQQIHAMIRQGEVNMIEDVKVLRVDLVHVIAHTKSREKQFTALITASLVDYYIDTKTNRLFRGSKSPQKIQEFWIFTWESGAWLLAEIEQTRESDALETENDVDMAGAPTQDSAGAGEPGVPGGPGATTFRGGAGAEGAAGSEKLTRLVQRLAGTDPLWAPRELRNVARLTFLAVLEARERGDEVPLSNACLTRALFDELCDQIASARSRQQKVEFRSLCVRKVHLVHADAGGPGRPPQFTVRITAHAQTLRTRAGMQESSDPFVMTFSEYYTFIRAQGGWRANEIKPQTSTQLAA